MYHNILINHLSLENKIFTNVIEHKALYFPSRQRYRAREERHLFLKFESREYRFEKK